MHTRSFLTLFFYISFTFALDSSSWTLRSLLQHVSHKRVNSRRLTSRSIPTGWSYVGCATDGSARALSYSYTSSSLTQDSCLATCDSQGYIYAAPEYSSQCYCGNTLANGLGVSTASTDCNMACAGNSSQICGGNYRMSLFQKTLTTVATSGWTLTQACAVDTSSRVLQGYSVTTSSLTPALCQSTCASQGFTIAGVEYGSQCYCGNSLVGGTPTSASTSDCNTPCAGDPSSLCGGSWRIQVYTAPTATTTATTTSVTTTAATSAPASTSTGWVLSNACAVDTSARVLQGYSVTTSSLTPALCQSTCASQGFTMAGVEYGLQCYCGNSLVGGNPTSASASDCNTPCAGDSSSLCGGSWRIQIYTAPTATTTATTTSATTTATTSAPASTSTGWVLSNACVVDTAARVLQGYSVTASSLTPALCQTTCASQGFAVAGVEYGSQCYCGNSLVGGTPATASTSECNTPCAGDSSSMCGGAWRIQIYTGPAATTTTSTTSSSSTTTTTTTSASMATGWTLSRPCSVDTSARILQSYSYSSSSLTPAGCQLACAAKNFAISGVENGNECYCGNVYVGGAPANASTTDCSAPCAGAPSVNCGGSYRITTYTSTNASIGEMTTWDRAELLTALNAAPINFTTVGPIAGADITVDETTTYQNMDGFGASLTDSSAKLLVNLKSTNSANYYSLLHQLFDVTDGTYSAMSSVLRVPLGASDFSDTVWSYCDTAGDTTFSTFNINNAPAAVWTVLYDILAINSLIKIYIVPWSPPAWMKTGNTMLGGSLNSSYVGIYPTYLLQALQGFQSKGIPVYSIAIQNEPQYSDATYPSMTLPVATEATIGQALRTLMDNNGFSGVKIIGYEHNFNNAATYPFQLMQSAASSFAGASFHCYEGTVSEISSFQSAYPTKEVHLTECSGVYGSDWWSDIKWYIDNLFVGGPEQYGRSSMMWNLALDGNGLPHLPGADSCGTPCRGVVQIDSNGTWSFNQEFWPIAHAGKAIAPKDSGGAFGQRISVTLAGTYSWALRVGAYATARTSSADKTRYSLVVLNWRDYASSAWNPTPQTTTINFRGVQATYTFPVGLTTLSWYA
ncbi:glycoside hydrolase superfamily [Mycena maculata]|uniref:Glycoside hydrolase superfamily n=1 Tax=Mycena maculata TaxID=230809 RepID=A0AAD7MLE5_9AGAR|nr:glycoside hydrolase superfamily [Mycena maculata]